MGTPLGARGPVTLKFTGQFNSSGVMMTSIPQVGLPVLGLTLNVNLAGAPADFDFVTTPSSLTDGTNTATSTVAYVAPVNLRCAQHHEDSLAAGTTADKYFFNWSQPQVIRGKFDVSTRAINGAYPIGVVWIEDEQYIESESTGNLRVYDMPFGMGALMPLRDGLEPTAQAALMVADLVRAAFMDISQGKNALSTDVNEKNCDVFPAESGSYIGANIRGMIRYQHVAQDSTQEVFWQNTQF